MSIFQVHKHFNSRDLIFTRTKWYNSRSLDLFLLTSHASTSLQESPSAPSVLQTAYAKGSMVSSVIFEPILPSPLAFTVLPLLHYTKRKQSQFKKKKINLIKISIITYIILATGIDQRTYGIELVIISTLQCSIILRFCFAKR